MTKKKRKKLIKPAKRKQIKHMGKGIFIGYTLILSMFVILSFTNVVDMDVLKTSNGDFNVHLMGLSIDNPYDASEKVVVFSDNNGNPELDSTRTTWKSTSLEYWEAFNINRDAAAKPNWIKNIKVDAINHPIGWTNAPPTNYFSWASGNSWYATSGCTVDPDADYSGVPDLSVGISNLYASDSNGEQDSTYSYKKTTRTLIDTNGNERLVEIHTGFVTLEVTFSVNAEYTLDSSGNALYQLIGETDAYFRSSVGRMWPTLGTGIDFDAVLRIQIGSLRFDDEWFLNPDWWNFGNGILQVNKRGFGIVQDTDDDIYTIGTQDTTGWMFSGENDIEEHQNDQLQKFDSKEGAIDKTGVLTDDYAYVVDFTEQNPDTVYVSLPNYVALGMDFEPNIYGSMKLDSLQIQKVAWVQRITIQFYTSVSEPLAGENVNPITHRIVIPEPPPKDRLWDRIANWLAELLGVKKQWADVIMVATIIGVSIIIILILLAIFAPQVYAVIGKAIAGFFKRRAATRAARK